MIIDELAVRRQGRDPAAHGLAAGAAADAERDGGGARHRDVLPHQHHQRPRRLRHRLQPRAHTRRSITGGHYNTDYATHSRLHIV